MLIDIDGRRIVFTVRENKPDRRLSAILAPVSSGTDQPESMATNKSAGACNLLRAGNHQGCHEYLGFPPSPMKLAKNLQ
jgi:hypothetical protein